MSTCRAEFSPKEVRYLKLGKGNSWADACIKKGELHFGHDQAPHQLCEAGAWAEVAKILQKPGRSAGKTKDFVREIRDFYELGSDCLWITFFHGYLWWTFADPRVEWLGPADNQHGSRLRRTIGAWRNTDLEGRPLRMDVLGSRLTSVAAYRQTLCRVKEESYLLRRIRGQEEPILAEARQARDAMIAAAMEMIAGLHWADFEDMVDLIFARSGWQRVTRVGGIQKDIDIELREPATGARAFVQVKSRASQSVLEDYVERWRDVGGYEHLFFVCHTPKGTLSAGDQSGVFVWTRERLADMAIKAGLYDWLIEKSM